MCRGSNLGHDVQPNNFGIFLVELELMDCVAFNLMIRMLVYEKHVDSDIFFFKMKKFN